MKAQVKTLDGGVTKSIDLPEIFSEAYRPDLIKKAVMALQSTRRQPHGTYPFAGICSSAVGWGSGRGSSHVPRLKNGSRAAKV
ncbi:MAG TPA: 50S ribosomal protein L4, partial [Methanoregula sp.]|nr:50S ribosomal protein L4 [Methanoregula sp.]